MLPAVRRDCAALKRDGCCPDGRFAAGRAPGRNTPDQAAARSGNYGAESLPCQVTKSWRPVPDQPGFENVGARLTSPATSGCHTGVALADSGSEKMTRWVLPGPVLAAGEGAGTLLLIIIGTQCTAWLSDAAGTCRPGRTCRRPAWLSAARPPGGQVRPPWRQRSLWQPQRSIRSAQESHCVPALEPPGARCIDRAGGCQVLVGLQVEATVRAAMTFLGAAARVGPSITSPGTVISGSRYDLNARQINVLPFDPERRPVVSAVLFRPGADVTCSARDWRRPWIPRW